MIKDRDMTVCCFCGNTIDVNDHEPLPIELQFKDGSSQNLFTHIDCFGHHLHTSIPYLSFKDWTEK